MSEDFIGIYSDVLSADQCDTVISDFNHLHTQGLGTSHEITNRQKIDDDRINYTEMMLSAYRDQDRSDVVDAIRDNLMMYVNNYSHGMFSPNTDIRIAVEDIMVQRTKPTEGYHVWHSEKQTIGSSTRVFSWILYLNDVEEGGETEFLYLRKRIKPEAGKLIVFPSGYTHAHRGNPPLTGDKFIITGWNRFYY